MNLNPIIKKKLMPDKDRIFVLLLQILQKNKNFHIQKKKIIIMKQFLNKNLKKKNNFQLHKIYKKIICLLSKMKKT
jgi:hypothetical protein